MNGSSSAEDMDRVFTIWHEQVQLSIAAAKAMAQHRGMPLPPDSGNASLLFCSRESQLRSSRRECLGA